MTIDLGGIRITLISGGALSLDGGAMFGIIPKPLWTRSTPADPENRIRLACNCVLIETGGPGARRALIETGHGTKYDAKERQMFAIDVQHWLLPGLSAAGCAPADVEDVILSHLHFDHAGGLTQRDEPEHAPQSGSLNAGVSGATQSGSSNAGASAAPQSSSPNAGASAAASRAEIATSLRPTFPRARVHVQRREFDDARANFGIMTATYREENYTPIDAADAWRLLDGDAEIIPGVRARPTPGHTRGHQSILIEGRDRTAVYVGDVLPTAAHAGAAYNMAYDVLPLDNRDSKRALLSTAAERDWLLILDHEPTHPLVGVRTDRRWFVLEPVSAM
ncbi:MAG: MBL fold metallo-hydrolase [Phycisphaerales bacterium]|nr:MBL fold metallo-hydrolase [Phycisphaerales bacterium]